MMTAKACVFSLDDAYVMPFQVFFHSLSIASAVPADCSIFILHSHSLGPSSISCLRSFLASYGHTVSFSDATSLIPAELPIRDSDHVSPATFYRLFLAEILPPDIEQAVYLDADMLALRSIAQLFHEDLEGLIGAADHCRPADSIRLWGDRGGSYFQAGVLVIPVRKWREQCLVARFLEVMRRDSARILWWDQDVLNLTFRDSWQRLPVWFNVCEDVQRTLNHQQVADRAALIHFTGSAKPWNSLNPSPFTQHWDMAYEDLFGEPFNRAQFLPPQPPVLTRRARVKAALRSRLSGLIHGRS